MQFAADRACRIALVPKDALDAPRWFEAPFAAIYHFADAYEHRGEVVVRAARHMDIEEARSPMAAEMRGERGAQGTPTELVSLRLDLARNRARWETHGVSGFEFPTFDARTPGDRAGAAVRADDRRSRRPRRTSTRSRASTRAPIASACIATAPTSWPRNIGSCRGRARANPATGG